MVSQEPLLRLIELVYDAAAEPARWPFFLEELAVAVGGGMTCLTIEHPGQSDQPVTMTCGLDDDSLRQYSDYYVAIDPLQKAICAVAEGEVDFGEPLVPKAELVKTEIFNDWYRPNGLSTDSLGGIVMRRGSVPSVLGIYQTRGAPDYGKEQLALAQGLVPHVRRALQIHYRLGLAAHSVATLLATLDELAFGVVLVDARGRITAANRAVRELARQRDGISLTGSEIRAGRPAETRAIQRGLADAIATTSGQHAGSGATLIIGREPPKRPLELLIAPLRLPDSEGDLDAVAAAVFVSDPDCAWAAPSEQLRALYGLTPREAAVAAHLSEGRTPREIAEQLGISVNTVKVRLQEVFAKTGTHRQAELMRLLSTHASRIRLGS